jgi:hypothetical protein
MNDYMAAYHMRITWLVNADCGMQDVRLGIVSRFNQTELLGSDTVTHRNDGARASI